MSLEKVLNGIKALDTEVRRQYSKLPEIITQGRGKYATGYALQMAAGTVFALGVQLTYYGYSAKEYEESIAVANAIDMSIKWGMGWMAPNFLDMMVGVEGTIEPEHTEQEYQESMAGNWNKVIRLPMILTGIAIAGYTIAENLYNGEFNGNPYLFAIACIASASSMYLKSTDRSLLDGESLMDRATSWLKEKTAQSPSQSFLN